MQGRCRGKWKVLVYFWRGQKRQRKMEGEMLVLRKIVGKYWTEKGLLVF